SVPSRDGAAASVSLRRRRRRPPAPRAPGRRGPLDQAALPALPQVEERLRPPAPVPAVQGRGDRDRGLRQRGRGQRPQGPLRAPHGRACQEGCHGGRERREHPRCAGGHHHRGGRNGGGCDGGGRAEEEEEV
ncbi:hypothetical protein KEM52_004293, partial [Ascosphaera acerosa]